MTSHHLQSDQLLDKVVNQLYAKSLQPHPDDVLLLVQFTTVRAENTGDCFICFNIHLVVDLFFPHSLLARCSHFALVLGCLVVHNISDELPLDPEIGQYVHFENTLSLHVYLHANVLNEVRILHCEH